MRAGAPVPRAPPPSLSPPASGDGSVLRGQGGLPPAAGGGKKVGSGRGPIAALNFARQTSARACVSRGAFYPPRLAEAF